MDRTDYPGMLAKLQPGQAVEVLNDRVRQAGRLNTAIADWLQERSRLEEQYAAGLRKLARKSIDNDDLGVFSVPWTTLTNSMDTLAESHSSLASKIEVDIEKPLRDFERSNREMQAMSTMQGNTASMARDVEKAQQKTDKLQVKGERAESNRVANASSDLDNARIQWETQAPYVFETLQSLDEARLNQLRDLLTQFQTLEVDQVEKNRVAAEQCLNILLNIEVQDEIKIFSLKAVTNKPNTRTPSRSSIMPSSIPPRGGSSNSNALAPIPSETDDTVSQLSATPGPSKKGGFKGMGRKIGTIMKRSSTMPKNASNVAGDVSEKETKSRSGPFGRLGRSKDSYNSGLEPPMEENSSRRPQSPLRVGSEVLEPTISRGEGERRPSADPTTLAPMPYLNGTSSSARPISTSNYSHGGHGGDLADLEPPKPVQSEPAPASPQRDSEGFSVPPGQLDPISQAQADAEAFGERAEPALNVNIRSAPIQEEGGEAALASVAKGLQAPPPTTRRAGTVRGRRDNRNSVVIGGYGTQEPSSTDVTPLPSFPSAERSVEPAPLATNIPGSVAAAPVVAQTVQPAVPEPSSSSLVQSPSSTFPSFSPISDPSSPLRPASRAAVATDHTGDNQSIRSGYSTASQGNKHPDLQEPGLSSSIVETVSARFENGRLVSSALIGEIALAYNAADFNSSLGHENIRIEHFSGLEKVAPNPAFITQTAGKEGEYSVNLTNLARGTQLAFKYQLRQDDAHSLVPVVVTPACKVEPTQTSVIVSYSLHPDYALHGKQGVTVSNLMIALTLEGAKASQCQTKPQGTFNKERNLIYWQIGDVTLSNTPTKLLARFATDGEAKSASVEARWEITGDVGSPLAVSMLAEGADPFADEDGGWKSVPAARKLTSGNYVAKS